jgi:hypothetical protein
VYFDEFNLLLIRYSAFIKRKQKIEYNRTIRQPYIDWRKAYDSIGSEVLHNILTKFSFAMKLIRLLKVYLNKAYSTVCVGKHLSEAFLIQNGLKQWSFIITAFQLCPGMCHQEDPRKGSRLGFNRAHQLLVYDDHLILLKLRHKYHKENTEALLDASKKVGLEVNSEKTTLCSRLKTTG